MLNYIKSECYRALHTRSLYLLLGIFAGLTALFNLVLYLFTAYTPNFRYGTTSFSYSNLVSQPMLYCIAACIVVSVLYEGDSRNGTRKNSIAYGISRTSMFLGKCVVSLIVSLIILIPIMAVYLGSAVVFLEETGPVTVQDMLMEIPGVSLIALSALILAILLLELFDKTILGLIVWYAILFAIPKLIFILSMKLSFLTPLALWLPVNFFSAEMTVNLTTCSTIWQTAAGMAKCLLAGTAGILLFGASGVLLLRKKDLS